MRSPMAVNVDFSRGTIRPRLGAALFYKNPDDDIPMRVLGLSGFRKRDGDSLVVAVVLLEDAISGTAYPWKLEFQVFDTNGTRLSNVRIDQYPLAETADPDNYYTMTQFHGKLFIASKGGRVMKYDYHTNATTPEYATALVSSAFTDVEQYASYPQGSLIVEHEDRIIVAGFDGVTAHSLSTPLSVNQNTVDEETLDAARGSSILGPRELVVSDAPTPDLFGTDRNFGFPGAGAITGLASTPAGLLVLTENNVYMVKIYPAQQEKSDLHEHSLIAEGVGCVSQRSVCQGQGLTAWLGHDGIYMFDGRAVTKISDDLADLWSSGRWEETPMSSMGQILSNLGYPFVLHKTRMDRACGTFDASTGTFIWSLPLAGHEKNAFLVVTHYPATGSWSMSAPMLTGTATGITSFRPTNFAVIHDRGRKRVIFSDYSTGLFAYNESVTDFNFDDEDEPVDILWAYQSPGHDLGAGATASPKALQIRQRATGSTDGGSWYIETERNFDMEGNELASGGNLHTSPQTAPPTSASTVTHYWDQGNWNAIKWHRGDVWRARYPVGPVNGNSFRVGLTGQQGVHRQEFMDYAIELDRKRDVT